MPTPEHRTDEDRRRAEDLRRGEEKLRRKFEEHQRRQATAGARHDAQVAQASQTLADAESEARRARPIPRYGVLVILAAVHIGLGSLALAACVVYAFIGLSANDKKTLFFLAALPTACCVGIAGLLFVTLGTVLVALRDIAQNSWKQLTLMRCIDSRAQPALQIPAPASSSGRTPPP